MSLPITNNYGTAHIEQMKQRGVIARPKRAIRCTLPTKVESNTRPAEPILPVAERTSCAAVRFFGAIAFGAYQAIKVVAKFVSWPARAVWAYLQPARPTSQEVGQAALDLLAKAPDGRTAALMAHKCADHGIFKRVNIN